MCPENYGSALRINSHIYYENLLQIFDNNYTQMKLFLLKYDDYTVCNNNWFCMDDNINQIVKWHRGSDVMLNIVYCLHYNNVFYNMA